jgi:protease I
MANDLSGRRIAFLVANEGVEEVELTEPWKAVEQAGGKPELIAPQSGEVQSMQHLDKSNTYSGDRTLEEIEPEDYDGVVLPGGVANPDQLRTDRRAIDFLQQFFAAGKPVGVICHGPWTLVEADLLDGRTITSWPSLQTRPTGEVGLRDVNAGAVFGDPAGDRADDVDLQPSSIQAVPRPRMIIQ